MKKFRTTSFQPEDVGCIHFVGIGGIGMSGIAEILHNLGYQVQGSDMAASANTKRLEKLGIKVAIGQEAENVAHAAVVVVSSAIKDNNPEMQAARKNSIPVIKRAEMLAELMGLKTSVAIAGTHGKTTTTSMAASLFDAADLNPTVINGGIINAYGTNAKLGNSNWLIAEADESDGTFLKLPATIGIITNIEPEHMEHYGSYENLQAAFREFIHNIPFYGFGVVCKDQKGVQELLPTITDRRVLTYGITSDANVKAVNIRQKKSGSSFDVEIAAKIPGGQRVLKNLELPMPGKHNILNALAVVTVALELEMSDETILKGFQQFKGVKRRFTKTGEVDQITIIDDYGHHPTEIKATLKTAKDALGDSKGRVIAVLQPHRYSRVQDLFDEFCHCLVDADEVIVTPIYEAGETPIKGITQETLIDGIVKTGQKNVQPIKDEQELATVVDHQAKSGDFVVCLGAGNISLWANNLPKELESLRKKHG